jgi:hypothetical protein
MMAALPVMGTWGISHRGGRVMSSHWRGSAAASTSVCNASSDHCRWRGRGNGIFPSDGGVAVCRNPGCLGGPCASCARHLTAVGVRHVCTLPLPFGWVRLTRNTLCPGLISWPAQLVSTVVGVLSAWYKKWGQVRWGRGVQELGARGQGRGMRDERSLSTS